MSVLMSDSENSNFSDFSQFSPNRECNQYEEDDSTDYIKKPIRNIADSLINRQLYGRFTKNPKAKTERIFNNIYHKCKFGLSSLLKGYENLNHIFMGFTLCGQYFISFTEKSFDNLLPFQFNTIYEYELYLWRFVPGQKLKYISKHRIFKHLKGLGVLDKIMFMQFPKDPHKILCYGLASTSPAMVYITILTLPFPKSCKHCTKNNEGWCVKHGFVLHYMLSMSQPCPNFDPHISLAYPDHLIINTGHYIHILNVTTQNPPQNLNLPPKLLPLNNDTLSEVSSSVSEYFNTSSIVDAIIDDFEDLEGVNECNKPFHELNISCEPLNVTGKSYHNNLVQNIVDPRFNKQRSSPIETNKIAEKAYEFIEEDNEKCEKLSSFRKKRLAEKKYEFSEDNSENIVPFNSLRRRYLYKSRCMRSPDYFNSLFLSPKSPHNHHSRSPISPKDSTSARKFYVYSPSLCDSDCSDSDSRLILKVQQQHVSQNGGLLILDPTKTETPKWIKKVVRRYSNGDFENSSLLSGQSRDDYNIPIEIPLLVHTLSDQHLDVVPDFFKVTELTEMQLIVTQRTFDCEQFVQRRAQKLCTESQLEFLHCQDYDIKLIYVCPLDGHIICQAVIKLGALKAMEPYGKPQNYTTHCLFVWNILTDDFQVIEQTDDVKLYPSGNYQKMPHIDIPKKHCEGVLVMDYCYSKTKTSLRDHNNLYEICLSEFDCLIDDSDHSD